MRTRFENLDEVGKVSGTTYGARIYDDMGNAYGNFLANLEDLVALDRKALVDHIKDHSDIGAEMLLIAGQGLVPLTLTTN